MTGQATDENRTPFFYLRYIIYSPAEYNSTRINIWTADVSGYEGFSKEGAMYKRVPNHHCLVPESSISEQNPEKNQA
jgi:hypothetical protein